MNKLKTTLPISLIAVSILALAPANASMISKPLSVESKKNTNIVQIQKKTTPRASSGWSVKSGEDLETILKRWASRAGWSIIWKSDNAYHLAGSATFNGDFMDALEKLMEAMQDARPAPIANIYSGNRTIVITDGLGETF